MQVVDHDNVFKLNKNSVVMNLHVVYSANTHLSLSTTTWWMQARLWKILKAFQFDISNILMRYPLTKEKNQSLLVMSSWWFFLEIET